MANVTVTVLEADGTTETDVEVLGMGRQAAAASKSVATSTEDKAVLDSIVTGIADLEVAIAAVEAEITTGVSTALPAGDNNIGNVDVATITAGETHIGEVGGKSVAFSVTLSTDTSAYASGDLIADTQIMNGFFRKADGTGVVQTITIIDEDAQGVSLYVLFMRTSTSMGSENSAPNISDANLTAGLLGIVAVATTDYVTLSGAKVATIKNIGIPVVAATGTDDLYIAVLNSTGTPTYTASGLEMVIGGLLD
jgi:hypothetical protein